MGSLSERFGVLGLPPLLVALATTIPALNGDCEAIQDSFGGGHSGILERGSL